MYIDSHTHLNDDKLFKNWQLHIKDFEDTWWWILINSGADDKYNKRWIDIAKTYNWPCLVKTTIWFHPYEVVCGNITEDNLAEKIKDLKNMYENNKDYVVAIWECGIDVHYKWELNISLQKQLFIAQLELAKTLNLPVVIHSRDNFDTTVEVLKDFLDMKIYFHCRWYWPDEIKIAQNMFKNLWIWFDWNISYPNAQNIRNSLDILSLDKILLETDAPYLSPQTVRGKTNYPVNIRYIYDFVAKQLWLKNNDLENILEENCKRLYF